MNPLPDPPSAPLTDAEKAMYEWQMWIPDLGEAGQQRLKNARVLVSRCGGVGGAVALYLATAGVGRLVIAHGGDLKPSDLHRQILMTHDRVGRPRIQSIVRQLRERNPHIEVEGVGENVSDANAERLVQKVDLVVDCAPLFAERMAMNRAAVRQHKPMVECAMYELEARLTTFVPGRTPCLACLHPVDPPAWKRQFPVLGPVAGMVGCLGAMEAIKLLAGFGEPLLGRLLWCDLRTMQFRTLPIRANPACPVCSGAGPA